jgi:hypothetical protein
MPRMRFIVLLLAIASLLSCTSPPDPMRYGVVKISLGPPLDSAADWRADQRQALEPLSLELDVLGPDFVWTSSADPESIVIRPAVLPPGACGLYRLGESTVSVDPACTLGYSALRRAAAHEVIHALLWTKFRWSGHLCYFPLNDAVPAGCHPRRLCRDCVMSPGVQGPDVWGDNLEDYTPYSAVSEPQQEDIDLVRSCFDRGACE